LADWAGHGLADSSLTFSITVGPATAVIRGQVQVELTGPVRVEAVGEGGRTYGTWADSAGDFALDGLLAGRYILWAFVDRDGDGVLDSGSLDPFVLSEPYGRYGESMDLASGQQVEEVLIRCR
jgi:hypothetical protein